jgi:hypothetical protein
MPTRRDRPLHVLRRAHNWAELMHFHDSLTKSGADWVFRGQRDERWGLVTTLERSVTRLGKSRNLSRIEGGLLRRFKRQAHHYLAESPPEDRWLEWLALMQHYGAPTRLLDWTYSFFVGLYFAVLDADGPSALWAIDTSWTIGRVKALLPSGTWDKVEKDPNLADPETFVALFARRPGDRIRLICPVNPYRLNQRLAIQQGTFLCAGDVSKRFESNLAGLFPAGRANGRLIKCIISLSRSDREDVMRRLFRMNVTSTSLFPGFGWLRPIAVVVPSLTADVEAGPTLAIEVNGLTSEWNRRVPPRERKRMRRLRKTLSIRFRHKNQPLTERHVANTVKIQAFSPHIDRPVQVSRGAPQ